jgi:uncharacterized protein Veg
VHPSCSSIRIKKYIGARQGEGVVMTVVNGKRLKTGKKSRSSHQGELIRLYTVVSIAKAGCSAEPASSNGWRTREA